MRHRLAAAFVCAGLACVSSAQLRVVTWNVSNYGGGRTTDIQQAVYGSFGGRSMNPDVTVTQEFTSSAAVASCISALNTAPGSPGTWAAGPFTNGPDTDNAFFYRSDRVDFVQM